MKDPHLMSASLVYFEKIFPDGEHGPLFSLLDHRPTHIARLQASPISMTHAGIRGREESRFKLPMNYQGDHSRDARSCLRQAELFCVRLKFETLVKGTDDSTFSRTALQMLKCASFLFNAM